MELEKFILSDLTQTQRDKRGIYTQVDVNCKLKDKYATSHRPREAT